MSMQSLKVIIFCGITLIAIIIDIFLFTLFEIKDWRLSIFALLFLGICVGGFFGMNCIEKQIRKDMKPVEYTEYKLLSENESSYIQIVDGKSHKNIVLYDKDGEIKELNLALADEIYLESGEAKVVFIREENGKIYDYKYEIYLP